MTRLQERSASAVNYLRSRRASRRARRDLRASVDVSAAYAYARPLNFTVRSRHVRPRSGRA